MKSFFCFWMALLFPLLSAAQTAVSLQQSVEMAMEQHPDIRNAQLSVSEAKVLTKTAVDLPKLQLDWTHGQMNTARFDNYFSVSQTFIAPLSYAHQRRLLGETVTLRGRELALARNRLTAEVKTAYLQWLMLYQRQAILQAQDTIYRDFMRAAQVKYKAGETNLLSSVVAATQAQQVQNALYEVTMDIGIQHRRLQQLLNTQQELIPSEKQMIRLSLAAPDTAQLANTPLLSLLRQQMAVQARQTRLERSRLSPDFSVGYFNQQLDHVNGFQGIQLGIAVPLWLSPYRGRVQAARIAEQATAFQFNYQQLRLKQELDILWQQHQKFSHTLSYFEEYVLRQADLIASNTLTSYRSGEIEYVEFVRNMGEVYQLRLAWLDALYAYNQNIIRIGLLLADEQ